MYLIDRKSIKSIEYDFIFLKIPSNDDCIIISELLEAILY